MERFHSGGWQLCKFYWNKRKFVEKTNFHRIGLEHQHGNLRLGVLFFRSSEIRWTGKDGLFTGYQHGRSLIIGTPITPP